MLKEDQIKKNRILLATDPHRHTQTISFPRATLPEEKLYALRAIK
jgi:hypothetical protein